MSSVGSSDSSNRQDEVIRRNREEYAKAEAEAAKRHKKEIRRMTEQHYRDIERLKQDHARQLEELKKHSTDIMSRRDHKYQQEIEEMRDMHRKSVQQIADENQRREESLRNATKGDMNQQKAQNDSRFEKLTSDYQQGLRATEAKLRENLEAGREAQAKALQENRERLTRAHQMQMKAVVEERNETVGKLQKSYSDYRDHATTSKKEQDLRHMQQMDKASDHLMRAVRNERMRQQDQEQILRDGFQDGLDTMRDRFEKAAQKERDAQNMSAHVLKSTAMERIDSQVRRLEAEKEDLKDANVRNQLMMAQRKEREVDNIREAWGKNIENYRQQRDEAIRQSNERNAKDVGKVRDDLGKQLVDNNRFYRGRMQEQGRIHRQAYDNLVGDFHSRQEHTQQVADQRVKTIFENAAEEKSRLVELQKDIHVATQRQHQDEMKALREVMENDKQQTVLRMQDQLRKQEVRHAERLNQVVQKYEKQMQTMKDQILREKRLGEENLKRTVDELQRAHKLSIDQLEAKNRDRVRQLTNQQADEIRQVNKRHEERLDQVLVEVKKT